MELNRGRTIRQICGRTIVRTLLLVGLALALSLGQVSARWVAAHAAGGSPAQVSHATCSPVVKVVPSPSPGSAFNFLNGIAAVSASNIWAVGNFQITTGPETLIEHWNGTSWSVVPSPSPGSAYNILNGIAAVFASNIWAVGGFANTTGPRQTLIEHWDGSIWSTVAGQNPGSAFSILNGIAAVFAGILKAVGGFANTTGPTQTLIERWDGRIWSMVPSPSPGSSENELDAIATASVSPGILWAVGSFANTIGPDKTLTEIIKECEL